jgi:hypothetical protein
MTFLRSVITFMALWITSATAQGQFELTVYLPGSPLNGQAVNAAGEAFYLGLHGPATYCPLSNQTLCPAGNKTIFAGMSAMFVRNNLAFSLPNAIVGD